MKKNTKNRSQLVQIQQNKSLLLMSAGLIVCSILGGSSSQAQVLNYEVPGSYGATVYSGQGAYSDPGNNYWNTVPSSGQTTAFDEYSDGSSANVTLSLSSYQTYDNGQQGAQGTPGGLLAPFILTTGAPVTGTLNDVAAGTYDLYLYGYNYPDGDRGTTFTVSVGSTSYGTLSTEGLNVDQAGSTTIETAFTEGVDYVEFTGLDLTSVESIDFTFAANGSVDRPADLGDYSGVNGEGDFNGLQLVATPEPSTFALLTVGLMALGGFYFSKRRQAVR